MTQTRKTSVKGGWVKRDASTGRFVAVHGSKGTAKASAVSEMTIKDVSKVRSDALKRLSDR